MGAKKRKGAPSSMSGSSKIKQLKSERCHFLEIPLELRQQVYRHYFDGDDLPQMFPMRYIAACYILTICRQVHSEAWPFFAGYCTFVTNKPMVLANNFLSLLPSQRLFSVKHLTLRMRDFDVFAKDFQRVWWYYLDVFSGLDTLTIESSTKPKYDDQSWSPLYEMINIIVGLMEQGYSKRAKWVGKKWTSLLMTNSEKTTASHDWRIDIGAALCCNHLTGSDSFPDGSGGHWHHKIVLRQHDALIDRDRNLHESETHQADHEHQDKVFAKLFRRCATYLTLTPLVYIVVVDTRSGHSGGSFYLAPLFVFRAILGGCSFGSSTRLLNDFNTTEQFYSYSTNLLSIAGRWHNSHSSN